MVAAQDGGVQWTALAPAAVGVARSFSNGASAPPARPEIAIVHERGKARPGRIDGAASPSSGPGTTYGSRARSRTRNPDDQVFHASRQRSDLADDRGLANRQAVGAMVGRPARGRPDRSDSAKSRGNAQRAADVVAESERRSAGGNDGPFAAAAAAARSFQIPRIVGAAVKRIVGLREDHELRQIGLGDRNRARGPQCRHIGIVTTFDFAAARRQAKRRCSAGEIEAFLDGSGSPASGELLAARAGLVDIRRGFARTLRQIDGDGVELAVDRVKPRDEMLDDFDRREIRRRCRVRFLAPTCLAARVSAWPPV